VPAGSPLASRPFLAVLGATVAAFGGYALLLPVLPLWVASGGAGPALAGSVTGVFMAATVATQLTVPAVLRAVGHRAALVGAAIALGAPAALLVLTPSVWLAMPVVVLRGAGFGVLTVAGAALVSDLVPARVRGRATGLYGMAIGAPQLVLLTGGVWAWSVLGPTAVLLIGAVLPVLAVPAMVLLPRRVAVADEGPPAVEVAVAAEVPAVPGPGLLRLAAAPWLVMLVCAASAGGVITVLPLAQPAGPAAVALFALTAAQLAGRGVAGEVGDRLGVVGRVTAPALVVTALGAGTVAWGLTSLGLPAVLVGAGLVGLGFGAVQNDTLVALFAQAGPRRSGAASSVWNTAYDAGTGLGSTVLAAVLGAAGAPWAFVVAGLACALTLGSAPWLPSARHGTPG
jgi:MFS family permease